MIHDAFSILCTVDRDEDAERALIGALLSDPSLFPELPPGLSPKDFSHPQHVDLYQHMCSEHDAGRAVDAHLGAAHLSAKYLSEAATREQLQALIDAAPGSQAALAHADRISKLSAQRRVTLQLQAATKAAQSGEIEAAMKIASATAAHAFPPSEQAPSLQNDAEDLLMRIRAKKEMADAGVSTLFQTGIEPIDSALGGGFNIGQLIVVAGRPNSGKTSLVNQIERFTSSAGSDVLAFSFEMSDEQSRARHLGSLSGVATKKILSGRMSEQEFAQVESAIRSGALAKIFFSDRRGSVDQIHRAILQHIHHRGVPKLITIDYLQNAVPAGRDPKEASYVLGALTQMLADVARTNATTVIAASQVNREHLRDKRKLGPENLAGGDVTERDAGHILLVDAIDRPSQDDLLLRTITSGKNKYDDRINLQLALHAPTSTFRPATALATSPVSMPAPIRKPSFLQK